MTKSEGEPKINNFGFATLDYLFNGCELKLIGSGVRMVPRGLNPVCQKLKMIVAEFQVSHGEKVLSHFRQVLLGITMNNCLACCRVRI